MYYICGARSAPRKKLAFFGGKYLFKVPLRTLLGRAKIAPIYLKFITFAARTARRGKFRLFGGQYLFRVALRTLLECAKIALFI